MWDELIKLAMSNGIWAVLFLGLLIFQLKDSASREKKYQKTIEVLSNNLTVVEQIKAEVEEIKSAIKISKSYKSEGGEHERKD